MTSQGLIQVVNVLQTKAENFYNKMTEKLIFNKKLKHFRVIKSKPVEIQKHK